MKQKLVFFILAYFRFFAKIQLFKNRPTIIGITGSAGKTSTRDAIYAAIKNNRKVKVSFKANSESGIPLNILGLTPKLFSPLEWLKLMLLCPIKLLTNWERYDTYLVEMGIDSPDAPKNMEYLLTIVKPDIGVLLNAAPMHSEPFDYLVETKDIYKRAQEITQLIANEKGKIVTQINKKSTAVLNIDQAELVSLQSNINSKLITFGENNLADIIITNYIFSNSDSTFEFSYQKKPITLSFPQQLLPKHFAHTFAATLSVGLALGITIDALKKNLETHFSLPPGRSSLIDGINGSHIIDSSYNSSTQPALDMLDMLSQIPGKNKFAVLGDIRELGEVAEIEHQSVAKKAAQVCNAVLLVGPQMKQFALPVLEKTKTQVHWFNTGYEAAKFLKPELKKDDLVLIKASQNTLLLEIAVENLMANPEQAKDLLARRGAFWDKKRAELIPKKQ